MRITNGLAPWASQNARRTPKISAPARAAALSLACCTLVAIAVTAGVTPAGAAAQTTGQRQPSPPGPALGWSAVPVQAIPGGLPEGSQLSVGNITCLSNSDCVAGGYLQVPNPAAGNDAMKVPETLYTPLIWKWDGHSWAHQASGTKGSVGLVGSACPSATDCWVVGAEFVGKLGEQLVGLILHSGGKSWSASPFPSPPGAALNGIACPSPTDCIAVGTRQTSATTAHALAESWDGSHWSNMPIAYPKAALWSVLESLTCYSPTDCLALGDADNSAKGSGYFFADRFDGTSWAAVTAQNAQQFNMGNDSGLFEISCPSENDCIAVGGALGYTHGQMGADFPGGVAEKWDGTSWSALKAPLVAADGYANSAALNGVSCTSPSDCWVAVSYPSILGPQKIAIAHWDGASFTVSVLPAKGFLAGISCLAENVGIWCTGIGEAFTGANGSHSAMTGGYFLVPKSELRQ